MIYKEESRCIAGFHREPGNLFDGVVSYESENAGISDKLSFVFP
jgi:hypothetical protein